MQLTHGAEPSNPSALIDGLLSDDLKARKNAQGELLEGEPKQEIVAGLIKIIEDINNYPSKEDSVSRAMFILGETRTTNAIEVLVAHIGFPWVIPPGVEPYPEYVTTGRLSKTLPAPEALIKIGIASIPQVINKVGSITHITDLKACAAVLKALKDQAPVLTLLNDALAKETDEKKRTRLRVAIARVSSSQ